MNLKEEFITWIYKNANPNLSSLSKAIISKNLDESNKFFDRDILEVDESNYNEILQYLRKELYNNTNKAFNEYSASVASHRPKALLGKENYIKFLEEKFGSNQENGGDENDQRIEFNNIISRLDKSELLNYFSLMDEIMEKLNLKPGDQRMDFSTASNKLSLVVGNRYCWNIKPVKNSQWYFSISSQKLNESSTQFGKKPPLAFVTESKDFNIYKGNSDFIISGIKNELDRTKVTRHKRNNIIFEKAVFDLAFRNEILGQQIPKKPMDQSLNTILYGPPGTGKTYYSKELAVRLANPQFSIEDIPALEVRDKINQEYQRLFVLGQVVFTTFHQSFSYEDFVEGIKPLPPIPGGEVGYEVQSGIFKSLCESATKDKGSSNFESAYEKYIEEVTEKGHLELKTPVQKKSFKVRINSNGTSVAIPDTEKATEMGVTKEMLRDYIINGNIRDWKPYTVAIADYVKERFDIQVEEVNNRNLNYVLIIDEINRGNISSIFGELITLLEQDKRLGVEEEIKVKLPYSKEEFGIPANLHIIGTMNTADRSVEALDTALRRRFTFEEIMPLPQLLREIKFKGFNLEEVLETINSRIEALLDRDHTIGHSYFIKIKSGDKTTLQEAFENRIIPLLQEYFYHDYEKIALILGVGFVERNEGEVKFANFQQIEDPEILPSFELKKEITDIEAAIRTLLNQKDEEAA